MGNFVSSKTLDLHDASDYSIRKIDGNDYTLSLSLPRDELQYYGYASSPNRMEFARTATVLATCYLGEMHTTAITRHGKFSIRCCDVVERKTIGNFVVMHNTYSDSRTFYDGERLLELDGDVLRKSMSKLQVADLQLECVNRVEHKLDESVEDRYTKWSTHWSYEHLVHHDLMIHEIAVVEDHRGDYAVYRLPDMLVLAKIGDQIDSVLRVRGQEVSVGEPHDAYYICGDRFAKAAFVKRALLPGQTDWDAEYDCVMDEPSVYVDSIACGDGCMVSVAWIKAMERLVPRVKQYRMNRIDGHKLHLTQM